MHKELGNIRKDYKKGELNEKTIHHDPFVQFSHWFEEVIHLGMKDPTAFCLSTIGLNGFPQSRIVLLKSFSEKGFVFFTNYLSQKGQAIAANPRVALTFFWADLERQVRIEGIAEKLDYADSDEYFQSRPRQSRVGAWASPQSEILTSREDLDNRYQEINLKLKDKQIVRPPHWGGYRVVPFCFEFWQGRSSRLHDRLLFVKDELSGWKLLRLAP